MTTYTYEPLVGITSVSDVGGKISYYEYDGSKRLLDIRDQSRNILKAFCYNYAGQPTNCGVNVLYQSAAQSTPVTKTCAANYTSTTAYYNLPLGKYTSTMSQQDADNQANADVAANAQSYANANCNCVPITAAVTLTNNTGISGYQITFGSSVFNFPTSGSTVVQVPVGSYSTVTINAVGTYVKTFKFDSITQTGHNATFTGITILAAGGDTASISN